MLVNENLFGKVTMSALSFSYTDEYDEDFTDTGKEDDFEETDDAVLNSFDDDIYGDEIDEEDKEAIDSYEAEDFDDDIYGELPESEDLE